MELKEGMYVRTKITDNCNCVYIRKITEIDDEKVFLNQICIDEDVIDGWGDERIYIDVEDIAKASNNIIDLIEVGDVIVDEVGNKYPINYEFETDYNDEYQDYEITIDDHITLFFKDGLSIVTKEQFSSMEYKVSN